MTSPRPLIYVAISGHGFGHATRAAAVLNTLQKARPDVILAIATTVPRWLLESYIDGEFIYRPRALDVGVVQADSLHMDLPATLDRLQELRAKAHSIIAAEVSFIRTLAGKNVQAIMVLADLPPIAVEIAQAAGLPCWAMGNFGWDFIYRDWLDRDPETLAPFSDKLSPDVISGFAAMADWVTQCWQTCDRLFRLPMHEAMAAFPQVQDVGLTGGEPRYDSDELRQHLGLPAVPRDRTVLLTFGGLGLEQIPYDRLAAFPDWSFITFDRQAPLDLPNLCVIHDPIDAAEPSPAPAQSSEPSRSQTMRVCRPVDLMPLCGRIVSKPGYSTFAEAGRLGIPIVAIERLGFAEAPLLIDEICDRLPHQVLSAAEFFTGDWSWLRQDLNPPRSSQRFTGGGNEEIVAALCTYIDQQLDPRDLP